MKRLDFLWYVNFGITHTEATGETGKDKAMMMCATGAYRDVCRTLKYYKPENKKISAEYKKAYDEAKKEFRYKMNTLITEKIRSEIFTCAPIDFDVKHNETIKCILDFAKQYKIKNESGVETPLFKCKKFYYGQAQKWLNMTLKNMMIMGLWETELERIKKHLHVPIDNVILEVAKKELAIIKKWDSWSRLDDYKEYITFQNNIRDKIKEYDCPIDWEFDMWIKYKQIER